MHVDLHSCIFSRDCCVLSCCHFIKQPWNISAAPSSCRRHSTPAVLRVVPVPRFVLTAEQVIGNPPSQFPTSGGGNVENVEIWDDQIGIIWNNDHGNLE